MERFKDLEITGPENVLLAAVQRLSENLPAGWHRDTEAEARLEEIDPRGSDAGFSFARDAAGGIVAAGVFLARDGMRLHVPNIVPRKSGQLTMSEYNRILDEFAALLRSHLPDDGTVTFAVSGDQASVTDWVSQDTADALRRFSTLANKSTGSSHPNDFERWAVFLIRAHREGADLHSDDLARWMVKEHGWSSDRADKLAIEYEFARGLLKIYDSNSSEW